MADMQIPTDRTSLGNLAWVDTANDGSRHQPFFSQLAFSNLEHQATRGRRSKKAGEAPKQIALID